MVVKNLKKIQQYPLKKTKAATKKTIGNNFPLTAK